MDEKCELNLDNPIHRDVVREEKKSECSFYALCFLAGLRIDYLDRPTARRFVIVRPQDNTTKRRTSRSTSHSSISSTRSSKERLRSISNEDLRDQKIIKRRSPSPPLAGQTFYGPFGSYFSSDDTSNVNNISDLITFCDKLNSTAMKTNANYSTVFSVQFILKSHAYDAQMHFLAGSLQLAKTILGRRTDQKNKKTELKVTQRLRLDPHKLDDVEKKLRDNVASLSSKSNGNTQSSSNRSLANQTNFAVLITSPKEAQRKSNGKGNSSDENDDRLQTKDDDDESSISRLISYLTE